MDAIAGVQIGRAGQGCPSVSGAAGSARALSTSPSAVGRTGLVVSSAAQTGDTFPGPRRVLVTRRRCDRGKCRPASPLALRGKSATFLLFWDLFIATHSISLLLSVSDKALKLLIAHPCLKE